ncbi:hypothetical protein PVK06_025506 [Gossypium arboreum]|uniref:Protein kinase domain-containing protein n=1 Tax=Gossypium arboreum TaxID=29729 RepID=A0ABR0PGQ2_GOSAR|nr:hypothetical protein PVK06_025506 [Gossypium arboreum]
MGSGNGFFSTQEFNLDSKWLIDPQQLFVGPKIGEGAHAKVYEGKYKNQNVAIKVVRRGETPEEIARREGRFAREVAMLSKVQHKNLVKFIGACKEPVMVIVTELLLGGTLRKYLLNMRPKCLDMCVAIGFALDIARAMECLHSHGIIHRDLKPENLILTEDHKTVKLADFGLAREESLTEMMTAETGTYRWMAPELYSTVTLRQGEKKHYNHKVDAYSFAIVLWELIHNKLPFEGMSNLQAAYAAAFKNVRPSAEDLPEDLAAIVTSCWQEDPNARPNFTQIIQMLLHYLSTVSPPELVMMPPKRTTSENVVFPPESPGTSSLMAARDDVAETAKTVDGEDRRKGFPVHMGVLKDERDDVEMALETLVSALTPIDHAKGPTNGVQPALMNTDLLSQESESIALPLSLPVRVLCELLVCLIPLYSAVQYLIAAPEPCLIYLIVVFEGAFEKIFSIIKEEGGSEGGVVVHDCLKLLDNLLHSNASNQDLVTSLDEKEFLLRPMVTQKADSSLIESPSQTNLC